MKLKSFVEPNTVFFPCVPLDSMIGDIVKFSNDIILELGTRSKLFFGSENKPSNFCLQFTKLKAFCFLFE